MAVIDRPRPRQRPSLEVHPAGALAAAILGAVLGISVANEGAAMLRAGLLVILVAALTLGLLRLRSR